MKAVGIICEFDPFHNGHLYLLERVKERFPGYALVCIMSGNFAERGDLAMFDKYARAKAAVLSGADLVLELPFPYSIFSAQGYAAAGVSILEKLGVGYIAFGAENGDISLLSECAENLSDPCFDARIKELCESDRTESYASAREKAYRELFGDPMIDMRAPNNILALEYISEIIKNGYSIKPFAVARTTAAHNGMNPVGNIASASYLRRNFGDGSEAYMPKAAYEALCSSPRFDREKLFPILRYKLLTDKIPGLYCLDQVRPTLIKKLSSASSISELCSLANSKTHTTTFINRAILSAIFGIRADLFKTHPDFTLLLAANKRGCAALKEAKLSNAALSIFEKPASILKSDCEGAKAEIEADRIYLLASDRPIDPDLFVKSTPYIEK